MLKRKIYGRLLEWKREKNGSTALMIEGARRIGKSFIAELFAQNEYDSYILIDFSKAPSIIKSWFDFKICSPSPSACARIRWLRKGRLLPNVHSTEQSHY